MSECTQCPNSCRIDRDVKKGTCGVNNNLKIAKYSLHAYEEPIISGRRGSGTIFFCGCSLRCVFCQNYEVSRNTLGKEITVDELINVFKKLEDMGAHNLNFVNPTHYSLQIMKALDKYRPNVPVVWNTHGYETLETLRAVDDYVDVYLTDLKYFSHAVSERYTKRADYFQVASKAVEFMLNAKKTVLSDGLIQKGVIVRHLILPLNSSDSVQIVRWLSKRMINGAYLSLMSQYTPFGDIKNFPELNRKITSREYLKVLDAVTESDFKNVFLQDSLSSSTEYIPKWDY